MDKHNISLSYGINRSPSIGHDGEMSQLINLIPKNGELVNILPPASMASALPLGSYEFIVAVHHVSPSDEDIYITHYNGHLCWRREGSAANSGTSFSVGVNRAYVEQVEVIGNILCLRTSTALYYYLWNGSGYTDLGGGIPEVDLQFGIQSSIQQSTLDTWGAVTILKSTSSDNYEGMTYIGKTTNASASSWGRSGTFVRTFLPTEVYHIEGEAKNWNSHLHMRVYFKNGSDSLDLQNDTHVDLQDGAKSGDFIVPYISADPTEGYDRIYVIWFNTVDYSPDTLALDIERGTYKYEYFELWKINQAQEETDTLSYKLDEGSETLMGMANELVKKNTDDNLFTQPFYVRYALKLTTGQYINISPPCLIEPNTLYSPFIGMTKYSVDGKQIKVRPTAMLYSSELYYRVLNDSLSFDIWRDVVESVVVAVTPPVYLYDQSASEESMQKNSIIKAVSDINNSNEDSWGVSNNRSLEIDGELKDSLTGLNYCLFLPTGGDRKFDSSESKYYDSAIRERMKSVLSTWYIVSEIPIKAIAANNGWVKLSLEKGTLATLYSQETGDFNLLVDTAVNNYNLTSSNGLFSYNNRLFYLGGVERQVLNWNPYMMSGYTAGYTGEVAIDVTISFDDGTTSTSSYDATYAPANLRFFAYPDSSAKTITFDFNTAISIWGSTYTGISRDLELQGESELAVGWWYNTYASRTNKNSREASISYPNKLYMSYQNQPLALDRSASLTFNGTIRAISVATKALSQGQFGQFPMYVFTSDGIWTLEVSSTGAITSSHPVSRDVITEGTKPLQTDDAVFFITPQGLKKLTGSNVTHVSTAMEGWAPPYITNFNLARQITVPTGATVDSEEVKLNAISVLARGSSYGSDIPESPNFLTGLQTATMMYDYYQQLIHIYMGNTFHYVYSLESGQWSEQRFLTFVSTDTYLSSNPIVQPNPSIIIPRYPLSIVQVNQTISGTSYHTLYRYDSSTRDASFTAFTSPRLSYFVTRPIAFDDPTGMKTLMDFKLIKQDIYGGELSRFLVFASKDNRRWHRLVSLKKGSYKYFRFAFFGLQPDAETLTGLTCITDARRTNKLR